MRNRYAGMCYRCGKHVPEGAGHFERHQGGWRVQHASCVLKHKALPAIKPPREVPLSERIAKARVKAAGTGNPAKNARRFLRDLGINMEESVKS